jgi:hypothetical protein
MPVLIDRSTVSNVVIEGEIIRTYLYSVCLFLILSLPDS